MRVDSEEQESEQETGDKEGMGLIERTGRAHTRIDSIGKNGGL